MILPRLNLLPSGVRGHLLPKTQAEYEYRALRSFFAKVDKNGPLFNGTPCWLFLSAINIGGYGTFNRQRLDKTKKTTVAHKWYWEYLNGPVSENKELDHLCRRRNCVNPFHLESVTRQVNVHRGNGPGGINARKTHCKRGHPLTPENLSKYMLNKGHRSCKTCANAHQVRYYWQSRG